MRRTTASIGILGVAAALSLTACGSDSSSTPSSGGSSGGGVTAACSLDSPPTERRRAARRPSTSARPAARSGVILPDTTSSTRYTQYDAPLLTKALKDAGITPDVQNAQGDKNKFASIAQNMIGEGVKVLIIDSIDAASGAGVEKAADAGRRQGHRLRPRQPRRHGALLRLVRQRGGRQAAGPDACSTASTAQGVDNPKIIMMNGGTDVDNNAVLFKKGAHAVLDPLVDAGKLTISQEAVVKGWLVENAAPAFQQALTAAGGKVDGVLAANDDIANAVIGVLKNKASTARWSSPVRTPASRVCRTSSPASSA